MCIYSSSWHSFKHLNVTLPWYSAHAYPLTISTYESSSLLWTRMRTYLKTPLGSKSASGILARRSADIIAKTVTKTPNTTATFRTTATEKRICFWRTWLNGFILATPTGLEQNYTIETTQKRRLPCLWSYVWCFYALN